MSHLNNKNIMKCDNNDNGMWLTFHSILDLMSIYGQTIKVRCYELSLIIMNRQKSVILIKKYFQLLKIQLQWFLLVIYKQINKSLKYFTELDTTYISSNTENQHCTAIYVLIKWWDFIIHFLEGFILKK